MAKTRRHSRKRAHSSRKSHGHVPAVGTRAQVWHGTAHHTAGGLTKEKLMMNKRGKIVSRKAHANGKRALKHLVKAGYKAKKGTFKLGKKML
jgi:hypothetical protein